MGIIRDFNDGRMDNLRSISYSETGTQAPYVTKPEGSSSNELSKRVDDLSRITQMLFDRPGVTHLANEALLKQGEITKKLESSEKYQQGTFVGNILRRVGGTLKHVAQVAGSTIAQVPVNGTGTHFLRAFRTDTYLQDNETTTGFAEFFGAGGVEGSQYALKGQRVPAEGLLNGSKLPSRNTTSNPGELGIYNIGVEGDLTTETPEPNFSSETTYTTTDTLDNVNNVVNGSSIAKPEALNSNTTPAPGSIGIDKKDLIGDLISPVEDSKYTSTDSYTQTDTISNATNVNSGQSIPKPADLLRNTTPSPGSLGVDKKDIIGDVTENTATSNYRSDTPYTETTTVTNIVNASVGAPINNPTGTGEFDQTFAVQTTSLQGTFGISNKAIEGDIADPLPGRSQIVTFNNTQLKAGGGRTATSTQDNIIRSRVGAVIPLLGAPTRPTDDLYQKGIRTLFNTKDKQFSEYINTGYGPVETRKKLIDLNTGEDGIGIGTITSLPKQFEQKYIDVEGARYLDSTENNSLAAQLGVPISNKNLYGNSPFNTTDFKGRPLYGESIDNRGVQGDITDLNSDIKNKFTPTSTYTGLSTNDTVNSVQSGQVFGGAGGDGVIQLRANANFDPIRKTSTTNQDVEGNYSVLSYVSNSGKQIQDFRSKELDNTFGGREINTYSFNYSSPDINKETRVGLGKPGKITRNRTSYTSKDEDTIDKINYLDVQKTPLDGGAIPEIGTNGSRDLIQLEFQVLSPDQTYYLGFRAFLDNFDDSFNASWNTHKYLGRADNFYTYTGFDRSINIGFKIAAQSREEMKPLYRKAATLSSVTAPTYGSNGRFMRGALAKVTVGDYIYEQPGIIESVQYTWQKDYPWEISFQNPEGEGGKDQILPHVLDVSVSFKVIHDFLPQTGINPFITNHRARETGNKDNYIDLVDNSKAQITPTPAQVAATTPPAVTIPPPVDASLAGLPSQIPTFD